MNDVVGLQRHKADKIHVRDQSADLQQIPDGITSDQIYDQMGIAYFPNFLSSLFNIAYTSKNDFSFKSQRRCTLQQYPQISVILIIRGKPFFVNFPRHFC